MTQLEGSLAETGGLELDEAIREHRALRGRTALAHQRAARAMRPSRVQIRARRAARRAAIRRGEIRARRLRSRAGAAPSHGRRERPRTTRRRWPPHRARRRAKAAGYSESPGRMNMISGTTHAGEVRSR